MGVAPYRSLPSHCTGCAAFVLTSSWLIKYSKMANFALNLCFVKTKRKILPASFDFCRDRGKI